jgi:hypothetical protein
MCSTLKTNWRDIVVFLLIGLGLVIVSGLIDYVSGWLGFRLILPAISNYLQGFSRFVGANIAASVIGIALWPTVNKFANEGFADAWRTLTAQQHLGIYIGLFAVEAIAAAICFSA